MSNDPKQPAKTIMGWSPQFPPGQQPQGQAPGQPAWPQQPQQPAPQQPPQQAWQQPQAPAPQPWQPPAAPPQQAWGQPPQPAPQPQWNQPPAAPPQQAWGQPQPPAPQPAWGQQPPQPQQPAWGQQPAPQPAWGQQPPQPPQPAAPAWQPPGAPAAPGWSAPAMGAMGGMAQAAMPSPAAGRGIEGADATVGMSARVRFIRLTYLHLFGAILAFVGIEWLLFHNEFLIKTISAPMLKFALGGRWNWGVVLAVFTGASILTHWLADQSDSRPLHYVGLTLYVIAEAIIFVPLLAIVEWKTQDIIAKGGGDPNIIRDSAFITLGVFGALTATVLFTKKDFSFLRSALIVAGAAAMGLIILSLVFGFNLGIVFAVAMVILAAGQILYETSQIMAHCDPERYVGAALSLFSSIALLFWYIIQIVMEMRE